MAHFKNYELWNKTTSLFTLPNRVVGDQQRTKVRGDFIQAIGPKNVKGVQILPRLQLRVEFASQSLRRQFDLKGLDFRGVHLTPTPGYTAVYQVFVEGAPLQSPNKTFSDAFASLGQVIAVKHLPVKGFPHIQSGTRMVSMTVNDTLPSFATIDGVKCKINYAGRPMKCFGCGKEGHAVQRCPAKANKATHNNNNNNTVTPANNINTVNLVNDNISSNNKTTDGNSSKTNHGSTSKNSSTYAAIAALNNPKLPHTDRGARDKTPAAFPGSDTPPTWTVVESSADPLTGDGWPERSVLPGPNGSLNVVVATPSKWVPIPHIDAAPPGPLPSLEDLDLPPLDSAYDTEHEEMPAKARKRGRAEVVVESDPEDAKRPLVVVPNEGETDSDAASERDDASIPDSIPDTTVVVDIDPDVPPVAISPPSSSFTFLAPVLSPLPSSVVEDHGVVKTTLLSERTVLDPSAHLEVSSPTSVTPTVLLEPATNGSPVMESPPSGDSTVAAAPQQHIEDQDIIPPKPPEPIVCALPYTVDNGIASVVLPSDDDDQPSDRTPSNVDGDEEIDIPGHETWDDDRCSSVRSSPSQDNTLPGEPTLLCSEPGFESTTPPSPGSDRFEDAEAVAIRGAIEVLLQQHLESSAVKPEASCN